MKYLLSILLALLAIPAIAPAQSLDKSIGLAQRFWINEEEGYEPYTCLFYPPASSANGCFFWDGTTGHPYSAAFDSHFGYNSGTKTISIQNVAWSEVISKPTFAAVATSGSYTDLSNKPTIPAALSAIAINNAPARSVVTVAAAANGWQPSATKYSTVSYSVTISSTVSLAGNSTGYAVLELAATNSATAGDWTEVARVSSGQSGTLVVGLTLTQSGGGVLSATVPAGGYSRVRFVTTAGSPTCTYNSGQEVQPPQ